MRLGGHGPPANRTAHSSQAPFAFSPRGRSLLADMNWIILTATAVAAGVLMLLEKQGLPTTLSLHVKGDVKRETRWLAQYGQAVCTGVAVLLIWQMDVGHRRAIPAIIVAVLGTSIVATIIKRLLSRVRPGRPQAGKFLGPHWNHANFRESFPSSHSACAVALSFMLAAIYPTGAFTFWLLAIFCAGLRYVLDAHWPSDVFGGIALGYGLAWLTATLFRI
jgi:membrane-associated phospholipid phosphatase